MADVSEPRHGQAQATVVFDFDLTLTHWDTASRFFRWLLRRQPWRLAIVLAALPVLGPLWLLPATRKRPVRFAVWVAMLGLSPRQVRQRIDQHVAAVMAGPEPVFVAAGIACLRAHLAQGDRVVVATGCLQPLARALLDRAGLQQVPLVASTMRPWLRSWVVERHCYGANKIPMLAERGFAPPWQLAYTDHHADLPVLRQSVAWFLVSPKPDCLMRIEQVFARPAPVLPWRTTRHRPPG